VNKLKLSEISYFKFKEDDKLFSSHWDVTSRCNYRCSYCTYNGRDEAFYPYEHILKIIEFYDHLYENYNLSLMLFGGEPLLHPDILKIVERLGHSIYPLQIFSNLSRSQSFLKELCSIRDDLKFFVSFHHEFSDDVKFLDKINLIKDMGAKVHAKVMWDSTKKEKTRKIYEKFPHIKTLDMIYHPNQTFTEEDKDWYIKQHKQLQLYNVDGEKLSYHEVKIRMNGIANFQGYHCEAGRKNLMVCSNGDVHPCLTYRKMGHDPLFNIIQDTKPIYFAPNICTEPECYSEIGIPKYKRKIPKLVCMVLGEKCNWNCKYCDRPKIENQGDIDFDLLKEYYPRIIEWMHGDIHISGGETALIDEEVLDFLFSFDKKLIIETNGLFFKRYFDKYYEKIKKVIYHCVPELDRDIEYDISDDKVDYLIVVHNLNIHLLKDFLNKNGDKNWILQYFYPKFLGDHEQYLLTRNDYFYLIRNFSHLIDVKEVAKRIIEPANINELRIKCAKTFDFVGFDFVNGRIKFCKQSHSFTNFTELNNKNFNLLIRDKLKNKEIDEICKTCTEVVRYF
jgi:MoaA/NifB/PqqE/SkfB family radical SAM enzyme